jgi:hypothetical protein
MTMEDVDGFLRSLSDEQRRNARATLEGALTLARVGRQAVEAMQLVMAHSKEMVVFAQTASDLGEIGAVLQVSATLQQLLVRQADLWERRVRQLRGQR